MLKQIFLFHFIMICLFQGYGQTIVLDEDFGDWQNVHAEAIDDVGDVPANRIDILGFKVHNDSNHLFIQIILGREIKLQENNTLAIYIDTDHAANTGELFNGIGAELVYEFGNRDSRVYLDDQLYFPGHADLGYSGSPTVSSDTFEIAFKLGASVNGSPVFRGNMLRILLRSIEVFGDTAPSQPGGMSYSLDTTQSYTPQLIQMTPDDTAGSFRLVTYNSLTDGLFDNFRGPSQRAMLKALEPDIICFQEIYDHSSFQVADVIEDILPSGIDANWYHRKMFPDIIIVSRFPIVNAFQIEGNGAFVVDLETTKMLLINAHLPCCGNDMGREFEIDRINSLLRDIVNGNALFSFPDKGPVIITGDLNLVGFGDQLNHLLSGKIFDTINFGADFSPDWDGSDLEDAKPLTSGLPMTYTWYDRNSSFAPGRLDFVIYSGSVLGLTHAFVLNTSTLDQSFLDDYELLSGDSENASDHLPVVTDFSLDVISHIPPIQEDPDPQVRVYPNPSSDFIQIEIPEFESPSSIQKTPIILLDKQGRQLMRQSVLNGSSIKIDVTGIEPGLYYILVMGKTGYSLSPILVVP